MVLILSSYLFSHPIKKRHAVSELSFQEGSVYNSEMECINLEQQSETEPLDVKLEQAVDEKSESHYSLPPMPPNVSGQVQASIQPLKCIFANTRIIYSKIFQLFLVASSNARGNSVLTQSHGIVAIEIGIDSG